ncbi:family 78 glycoside hydrolase catalytic domain [Streptomyces sp. RKAG290]|uniref:family 78 glycoside hydrolase catalytic domain n=1 Tax=Streptomyces sp. RKAG290 TaxID=2888348 RepID=UPI0020349942|nr:family 78 glycoside hydrolase catalytic domain [Streptomyces sp. RKAG290]MCM2411153.1 family 78 glycoside hydrolase catalytic domain [Streptomyces sp. RKAG290]
MTPFRRRRGRRRPYTALLCAVVASTLGAPAGAAAAPVPPPGREHSALAPTHLRADGIDGTDSRSTGVLVGEPRPTLSWTVNDSARAEAQTGYQIRVEPARTGHGGERTPGWDSGRVASDNSTDVAYAGPPLEADHTYTWSVRTWNRQGEPSRWSASASFDVGLLTPSDWSAWWLQVDDGALIRADIDVKKPVARARLYFAAQGIVEPHLNGERVEPAEVLDSSVTDYDTRVLYRSLDVTGQLHKGRNALAFMAGKGPFSGRPTFVAQLEVTYTDGSVAKFGTDTSWTTAAGPVTGDDFYYGETYDARKAVPGWDTAGFDEDSWGAAHAVAPASHPSSLAQGRPVTALDSTDSSGWSRAALTDGTDGSTDSSQGYHSKAAATADTIKWVQTDLGSDRHIRQIRLFPARPTNDPAGDLVGAGFPVRYRVQVSDDPAFPDAATTTVADRTGTDQGGRGTAPVELTADTTGRYVRVTATKLACAGENCTFRLAELGVYGAKPALTYDAISRLEADTTPPTRVVRTLTPVKETRPAAGQRVLDFGQNYSGWVTIRATAPAGKTVHIKKGEILDASGHVTTSNISFSAADPPRQTDHYTFSGSGTETYAPHFSYAGFRYAELTGLPDDARVTVTAQVVHSDVATTGRFSTSDATLNKIQGALTRTQLNNLQTMPLDCPTREKHGWLGDAGDTDQEAMSNFDLQSFYAKWLGDVVTSQNADGSVPSVAPANGGQNDWKTDPAWGSAFPQIIWDTYTRYGSTAPITTDYARVKAWVDYLGTISDADHVIVDSPISWGDDWQATVSTPHAYFQTGSYFLDAGLLAKMAAVMGNSADEQRYGALADRIAEGFTKRYYDADTGVYGTGTQLSYAMPLALGLVPAAREQATLAKLVQDIHAHDDHVTTGFVGTQYVFEALGKYHRNDVALAVATRTDYPSFGYMVNQGPGTIWEKWNNSAQPDGTSSKDHIGLAGSIGQWFYQELAGIQPGSTGSGYRTLTLAPDVVGDLTSASGRQRTVRGTVESSWRRDGNTLTYHAVVPVGSTATIELPLLGGKGSVVRESGRTVYDSGRPAPADDGLIVKKATDDALTLTAGSGDYTFTVLPPRTPFTRLALTARSVEPIAPGKSGDIGAVLRERSTGGGSATVGATLPAGWTATAAPARIPLTPATSDVRTTLRITVPDDAASGTYPVTVNVRAPDGTREETTVSVPVAGALPAGTTAAASSEHASNVVDGATRTYVAANAVDGNPATFWNDDTQGQYPDTLTVTTPSPVTLHGIGLTSVSDGVPTDFTVQAWDGSQWVTAATVAHNSVAERWIPFDSAVTTAKVRVVVTGTQDGFTRIAGISG